MVCTMLEQSMNIASVSGRLGCRRVDSCKYLLFGKAAADLDAKHMKLQQQGPLCHIELHCLLPVAAPALRGHGAALDEVHLSQHNPRLSRYVQQQLTTSSHLLVAPSSTRFITEARPAGY